MVNTYLVFVMNNFKYGLKSWLNPVLITQKGSTYSLFSDYVVMDFFFSNKKELLKMIQTEDTYSMCDFHQLQSPLI